MSKLFQTTTRTNTRMRKQLNSLASDSVDRIARRTPALFQKNTVPQVRPRSMHIGGFQSGVM